MDAKQTVLILSLVLLLILGTFAFTGKPTESQNGRMVLDLWHPWGGPIGEEFRNFIHRYNQSNDKVQIDPLFTPNDLSANQKFFLSVAGGSPPEITFVDGPQVAEWAARGALESIDDLMAEYGVSNQDFWEPCARQNQYNGKTYALTYCADPNFALAWNKELFKKAGLDPERGPRTIAELDEMAEKLTKMDSRGDLETIGLIPWSVYGSENSLFTWGWCFGGEFYNPETREITCDSPQILAALKWMLSYAEKFGIVKITAFIQSQQGFGTGPLDPFLTGKVAFLAVHVSVVRLYAKYKPDLDYGLAPLPGLNEGEEGNGSWVGGWCIGIPKGSKHRREAFEFMKWLCTSDQGTRSSYETSGSFPGYTKAPVLEDIAREPKKAIFLDILKKTRHQRPVMPAQAYYMGAIRRAVDYSLNNLKTPEEALKEARELTEKELHRVEQQFGEASAGKGSS
ncbi:MAG: ABC transporter substrate-binding protein [Candidatus Omnitrophica bacterium]|nr:ABC transporter substrate-binding protein [bacterium]MCL4736236.1 ABC transporter substrate-binding protein [Candidatus Omnitrophota bacterium]NUP91536.1 ABC transporter substrate-binding protein [Candidatus Omnitrophota bacterium]